MMQIAYLADYLHFVPTLAEWHHREWHHLTPWETRDGCAERLRQESKRGEVPTTLIAVEDDLLMGSASLVVHDMKGREDLSPWLASLYVAPEYRRQGIGTQLVQRIVQEANNLKIPALYLYTTGKENELFYEKLGWSVKERIFYLEKLRVIMAIQPVQTW
jgi:GNAT superfamily N-acetyltransferase